MPTPPRVVVVDDYEPSLRLFAAVIKKAGNFEAITFTDAREALRYIAGLDTALAIVDYNMPDVNGITFINELRGLPGRELTRIIMLTAENEAAVRREALEAGAQAFLGKPVNTDEFIAHIRKAVETWVEQKRLAQASAALSKRNDELSAMLGLRDRESLERLGRLAALHDPELAKHMHLAHDIAMLLGTTMNLSQDELTTLDAASLVYDIGKLSIPAIVHSRATLSGPQIARVRVHADAGARVIAGGDAMLLRAAEQTARHHHERFDGQGYPAGLAGDAIPLPARIVALADTFAALVSDRPYRRAFSIGQALDQVRRQSGIHFDPVVVEAFEVTKIRVAELATASLRPIPAPVE
jgi:putative two-component system response regulator